MKTYIALLRGINVGGHKKIKMADLKRMFESIDCKEVVTYVQSGNVVFKSSEKNIDKLENIIRNVILETFGFDVTILVKTKAELKKIVENNQFGNDEEAGSTYFVLLQTPPEKSLVDSLQRMSDENESFAITPFCVYLHCKKGYGNAKCNNNFFETKLKVAATTRNYKTMIKLLEMV
ncbi:DUF1697 domain-containing protein [Flavobacteriaceae bacterium F89]|uniref:DUF1697 domain-containing protein n=1 Tax=Cerina litoralis TaxID=2874477 RepID=A0AAE3JQV6_9FLAO|nr:DUF1697 domain-containing protein [Cerina litoralis]MCG2460648.1 DUF1697 domain-containing protein [Cerina litoralis]